MTDVLTCTRREENKATLKVINTAVVLRHEAHEMKSKYIFMHFSFADRHIGIRFLRVRSLYLHCFVQYL